MATIHRTTRTCTLINFGALFHLPWLATATTSRSTFLLKRRRRLCLFHVGMGCHARRRTIIGRKKIGVAAVLLFGVLVGIVATLGVCFTVLLFVTLDLLAHRLHRPGNRKDSFAYFSKDALLCLSWCTQWLPAYATGSAEVVRRLVCTLSEKNECEWHVGEKNKARPRAAARVVARAVHALVQTATKHPQSLDTVLLAVSQNCTVGTVPPASWAPPMQTRRAARTQCSAWLCSAVFGEWAVMGSYAVCPL